MAEKISLSDLESLKGLKEARGDFIGKAGARAGIGALGGMALRKRNEILDKAIAKFTYVVDNLDQEKASYVKSLFNNQLQLGYETTMSGLKQDAFAKTGFVPIDKETIYSAIVNMDLPKELRLEMSAIADMADKKDLAFSLANNNLGITYDSESQEIKGQYEFNTKDGKTSITPIVTKDADSKIEKRIEIERAIDGGGLYLDATKGEDTQIDFMGVKDGNVLNLSKNISPNDNFVSGDFTTELPLYMINENLKPTVSGDFYKQDDFKQYGIGANFPITENIAADIYSQKYGDGTSTDSFGIGYNKPIGNDGIFSIRGDIDTDRNKNLMATLTIPFGNTGDLRETESLLMTNAEKRALEAKKEEDAYNKGLIYAGSDFKELKDAVSENLEPQDFIGPKRMAGGGLAYLMGM